MDSFRVNRVTRLPVMLTAIEHFLGDVIFQPVGFIIHQVNIFEAFRREISAVAENNRAVNICLTIGAGCNCTAGGFCGIIDDSSFAHFQMTVVADENCSAADFHIVLGRVIFFKHRFMDHSLKRVTIFNGFRAVPNAESTALCSGVVVLKIGIIDGQVHINKRLSSSFCHIPDIDFHGNSTADQTRGVACETQFRAILRICTVIRSENQ